MQTVFNKRWFKRSLGEIELDSIYPDKNRDNKKDQGHNHPSFTTNMPNPKNLIGVTESES